MRLAPLPSTRRTYWHEARAPRYSLLFAVPLFISYELLAAALSSPQGGVRNGADVLIKAPFLTLFGQRGPIVFAALLALASAVLVWRDIKKRGKPEARTFVAMFAESVALAILFGFVVGLVTAQLVGPLSRLTLAPQTLGGAQTVMVSLGAGLYEELLFRVVLVGTLLWASRKLLGWGPLASGLLSTALGAVVFSAFHYVGAYGDTFTTSSFVFRTVAGVAFSGLYVLRGFGITAWTHALYDIMLFIVK